MVITFTANEINGAFSFKQFSSFLQPYPDFLLYPSLYSLGLGTICE